MPKARVPQTSDGAIIRKAGVGITIASGATVPASGSVGYAYGCIFIDEDASTEATKLYINTGSVTSSTFTAWDMNITEMAFLSGAVAGTPAANKVLVPGTNLAIGTIGATTIDTGRTLAVTTADLLTVGGLIIPQEQTLVSETISLHASKVTYNLFVARDAWQVTKIDYTPDIAQGGALTATVVKAVTTATPASATTPMHTANGIDLNATAHTVQPITITATGADLQLAAGNRIGLVLSGAMTVGSGLVTIRGKRI